MTKEQTGLTDNGSAGSVMNMVLTRTDYAARFAPRMRLIAATLLPYDDRIYSWSAGPQPQSKNYDAGEPPYIEIEVPHSQYNDSSVYIKITESNVTYLEVIVGKDGEHFSDGEERTTLGNVFRYLAALPSSPGCQLFDRGGDE